MASWIIPAVIVSLFDRLYWSNELKDRRIRDFIFEHKDSVKSISAFYAVFSPLQRPYKVVFQSCFPLLSYIALAIPAPLFPPPEASAALPMAASVLLDYLQLQVVEIDLIDEAVLIKTHFRVALEFPDI